MEIHGKDFLSKSGNLGILVVGVFDFGGIHRGIFFLKKKDNIRRSDKFEGITKGTSQFRQIYLH